MKSVKIVCLPVAGNENPYQKLMIKGLNSSPCINAVSGVNNRFFGILLSAIKFRPTYIHFDWETSYYLRNTLFLSLLNIPIFFFQIIVVKWLLGVKMVWTPHNITPHDMKWSILHKICRRFFAWNMEWVRVFSKQSIPKFSDELKIKSEFFKVVPEGSYVDYYKNDIGKVESRDFLNLPQDSRIYMYFGLVKPYKGVIELIESFKMLEQKNLYLLIVGKCSDKSYYQQLNTIISDRYNIRIVNKFIPDDEIQFYFNAIDVVVLPFKKIENSGSVILSMGFKKPIIAPKSGVIIDRLKFQPFLLFDGDLTEVLVQSQLIDCKDLSEIGNKNYFNLSEFNWSDFSKYFIND